MVKADDKGRLLDAGFSEAVCKAVDERSFRSNCHQIYVMLLTPGEHLQSKQSDQATL